MKGTNVEETVQFAGLTAHNNSEMSERAATIAGIDANDPPETSFAQAIRNLETAQTGGLGWEIPDKVADHVDVEQVNEKTPEGIELKETTDGSVFATADNRFQSVYSPEKLQGWLGVDDDTEELGDALWHVPTKDYSITNPSTFYTPAQEEIRDQDLGDHLFGEVRTYKGGGEVHMDLMFDAYEVMPESSDNPVVLGIRTGYDFFGGTALYAEGYAQDTSCNNSIRSVTEEKSRRHIGEIEDLNEWWADILEQLDLMTDALSEAIESANNIELDYLELNFAEAFEHDDSLRAFFELSGFPSYLARASAENVRSRADNQFLPTMWEMHSGATNALTHEYRGGANSSTLDGYIRAGNDLLFNPSQALDTVEASYSQRLARQSDEGEEQSDLEGETASAAVAEFRSTVSEQRDEYETRQDELEQMLVAAGPEEDEAED